MTFQRLNREQRARREAAEKDRSKTLPLSANLTKASGMNTTTQESVAKVKARQEKGAALIEYALLIALMCVVVIGAVQSFSTQIRLSVGESTQAIDGSCGIGCS